MGCVSTWMNVLKIVCAKAAAPRWCLIGLVRGSSAVCKIEHYMRQVSDFYRNGGTQPLGYNPDDKDSGYRSALRFWGIQQTSERSEEHTSELQSRFDLVCRLLLE